MLTWMNAAVENLRLRLSHDTYVRMNAGLVLV
jgi:hypothetical protein